MQTYEVYHYTDIAHDWFSVQEGHITVRRADYVKVAEVQAENLNEVFRLTNTIERDWQQNPNVTPAQPDTPQRSTSVGDVIVLVSQAWIVDHMGFAEITFL